MAKVANKLVLKQYYSFNLVKFSAEDYLLHYCLVRPPLFLLQPK